MADERELKPCPFCGAEATITAASFPAKTPPWEYYVGCSDDRCCAVMTSANKDEAIRLWNTREPLSESHKALQEIVANLRKSALQNLPVDANALADSLEAWANEALVRGAPKRKEKASVKESAKESVKKEDRQSLLPLD